MIYHSYIFQAEQTLHYMKIGMNMRFKFSSSISKFTEFSKYFYTIDYITTSYIIFFKFIIFFIKKRRIFIAKCAKNLRIKYDYKHCI